MNEVPYGIAGRPMPDGSTIDRLLPVRVGSFARDPVKPPAPGMSVYGNYKRGAATIFMELAIGDNARDAEATLETAAGETGDTIQKSGPIGFFRSVNADGAFMAWTRGRYYFSACANGGEKDLDEFMQAFPF
jgi:hypothetical protein